MLSDHEQRQMQHDVHQIKQHVGCLVTTGGLIWILLACIFALLALGCDTAVQATAPDPIKRAWTQRLTCAQCEPAYMTDVLMSAEDLSWQGGTLVLRDVESRPDTLRLPRDASMPGFTEPQIVFTFYSSADPSGAAVQHVESGASARVR